ncbi:MAG: methyltransferase domain-containing protein [Actinobacteria bacterium]|nr:methyltransferase domain-containing protein [Actinomycetota bacterium]
MPTDDLASIYDEFARTYTSRRDVFDLTEVLDEFLDRLPRPASADSTAGAPPGSPALLDLGCGAGEPVMTSFRELGWSVTGVDFSPGMIQLARNRLPDASLHLSDMTEVDFEADSFDAITAVYSLFHVASDKHPALFAKCRQWLRPGGLLMFTYATADYTGQPRFDGTKEFMGHTLYYSHATPAEMHGQLTEAGLRLVAESSRLIGGETFLWVTAGLADAPL